MSIDDEIDSGRLDTSDNRGIETNGRNIFGNYGMNRRIRMVGVGSSMREGSFSTLAVKMVLDLSKNDYGAQTYLIDLRQTNILSIIQMIVPTTIFEGLDKGLDGLIHLYSHLQIIMVRCQV
jgi:hypothetical protein